MSHPAAAVFATAAQQIRAAVRAALPDDRPVGLVNFPNHGNPGDDAIWLGAEQVLADLQVPVAYRASWLSWSVDGMRSALADGGPVLLTGGGNFGDLYRNQQATRERVLAEATDRRVVQLPQTIDFADPEALERSCRLCDAHPDLVVMAREEASTERARRWFSAPVELVPDLAFALVPHDRPAAARTDVLWLARDDVEARHPAGERPAREGVERLDWLGQVDDEPPWSPKARRALKENRKLNVRLQEAPTAAARLGPVLAATFAPLAEQWVARGEAILSRGRVVITDRLHGHLLALRCGIPSVVMANTTGKVEGVHHLHTAGHPLVRWAQDPEQALAEAHGLLAEATA